ncbi:uncharacterized protein LOC105317732 [Rhizophagus irregularis DAOM 181602=DAOM 197198]|nr:uncharacterized protein LOC105317732 [Rhizophagus irregularis DAOM 181602=DAOM 197198]
MKLRADINDNRVRDHDHFTGKYRGPAHRGCNLQLQIKPDEIKIPLIYHGGKHDDNNWPDQIYRFLPIPVPIIRKNDLKEIDDCEHEKIYTISQKQYDHAQTVWEKAECKTFGDYPLLYLITDVLILADSIQRFRKTMKEVSGLDPLNYITLPSFAFDMAKNMTKVKLKLFHKGQEDMHEFMPIIYTDGYVTIFTNRWLDLNNLPDIRSISPTAKRGSAWEVKLRYLENLHPAHSDYLLCPERRIVKQNELSPYQNNDLIDKLSGGKFAETEKLVATLETKDRYIIHYRNLQQCLELGMELEHVYRVLEFDQSPWLELYITANTIRRRDAKNAFEKDLWKLMNNAVFGKTMEDVRHRTRVDLVRPIGEEHRLRKMLADLVLVGRKIFHGSKSQSMDQAKLCYTDTDSLIIEIENDADMIEDADLYDFSDYPEEHPLLEKLPG